MTFHNKRKPIEWMDKKSSSTDIRSQDVKGRPDRRQKENCCTKTRFHILMWKVQPYLRLNEDMSLSKFTIEHDVLHDI